MFINIAPIVVLFLAWLTVIVSFFVLAVQLFVTLIEFKLTTLAGFVLVPFALWNKTAFMAEKVLGNVVSSGIKVLVLAVIVGIGTGLFSQFQTAPVEPSIDHALVVMLASLSLLGLGIFGPGIATGLVSGAPQLGAGAAAGTVLGATGLAVAGGAAVAGAAVAVGAAVSGVGSAVAAGARMAPAAARMAGDGARSMASTASSARSAYQAGSASAGGGLRGAAAGVGNVAKTGAQAAGQKVAEGARSMKERVAAAFRPDDVGPTSEAAARTQSSSEAAAPPPEADPGASGAKAAATRSFIERAPSATFCPAACAPVLATLPRPAAAPFRPSPAEAEPA